MRQVLGRIAVAVCDERLDARAVPPLIAEIAKIAESEILPSKGLPSRPAAVAAPVFKLLRRTAKAQQNVEAAIQHSTSEAPRAKGAGGPPVPSDPIANALAWLDGEQARKAFVRVGAPYARAWLREALEWARKNPEAKPPRLPEGDPLAPKLERVGPQPSIAKRGREKGSIVLSSKTRDLALLVLYLVDVEGVSLKAATRRVCDAVAQAHGVRPDIDDLRNAREELKLRGITPAELTHLALASVERYLLPESIRDLGVVAVRQKTSTMLHWLIMPGKNSHPLRSSPRN